MLHKSLENDIWRDQGVIPLLPEEDKMLIRSYPMGLEDQEYSRMARGMIFTHKNALVGWSNHRRLDPLFLFWRTVFGKPKGRMVIESRPLNKITISDTIR
jgi:hypothetical protein